MSNIVLSKSNRVTQNLIKSSERKRNILSIPSVQEGVTELEYRIAESAVLAIKEDGNVIVSRKPIKSLSDEEIKREIGSTLKFITRDLGIKNWSGDDASYESVRFLKLLRDYYSDLTYKEVENAFELLMAGHLNEFLPKSQGQPDKGHYQSFSVEFVTKVLNAFKEYKKGVWSKVNNLIPQQTSTITEDQKKENSDYIVKDMISKYEAYRDTGEFPDFRVPFLIVRKLSALGYCSEEVFPSDEDKARGFQKVVASKLINQYDKMKAVNDHGQGKENAIIKGAAQREASVSAIKNSFDSMIEMEIDLRKEVYG